MIKLILVAIIMYNPPVQAEEIKTFKIHKESIVEPEIKEEIVEEVEVTFDVKIEDIPEVEEIIEEVEETPSQASSEEIDLFSRLVEAEAKGESYTGKVAVAEVVLNRVNSSDFPNSITDVIHQSGQFSPVSDGSINGKASQDSINAVNEAMQGSNIVGDSLFFWNPSIASNRWLDSLETVTTIGNHEFKR